MKTLHILRNLWSSFIILTKLLLDQCYLKQIVALLKHLYTNHNFLLSGPPADIALLVIGQFTSGLTDQSQISAIHEYAKQGGACLCTGTGCMLFNCPEQDQSKGYMYI